jgi:hypothetical protein
MDATIPATVPNQDRTAISEQTPNKDGSSVELEDSMEKGI